MVCFSCMFMFDCVCFTCGLATLVLMLLLVAVYFDSITLLLLALVVVTW